MRESNVYTSGGDDGDNDQMRDSDVYISGGDDGDDDNRALWSQGSVFKKWNNKKTSKQEKD